MAVKQTVNFPRVEVKARISTDLHKRMMEECGLCQCHISGFVSIAIAREVAKRKKDRKLQADLYIEQIAEAVEAGYNA